MKRFTRPLALVALSLVALLAIPLFAQNATQVSLVPPSSQLITVVPISATAAVNTATTLTIPAPVGGMSNYVCALSYVITQDATSSAVTNAVTTSTNFNSFALKASLPATANLSSGVVTLFNTSPAAGCVKSTVPGTATTFVSPASLTNTAWTWHALYFQAP